jgi:hypothetical protein
MIDLPATPRLVPPIHLNPVAGLAKLRQELEATGSWPEVEVPAALLLADVCQALGLNLSDQQVVLGAEGTAYFEAVLNAPIVLAH